MGSMMFRSLGNRRHMCVTSKPGGFFDVTFHPPYLFTSRSVQAIAQYNSMETFPFRLSIAIKHILPRKYSFQSQLRSLQKFEIAGTRRSMTTQSAPNVWPIFLAIIMSVYDRQSTNENNAG